MQGFAQGISFRLAKVGVVIAFIVGILMSAVQMYIDYQVQSTEITSLISRITEVSTPPAVRAVHTLDDKLAREVATGLMRYDFIIAVTIEDEEANELASASKPRQESNTHWFTQFFTDDLKLYSSSLFIPGEVNVSGHMLFVVDLDIAYRPFYQQSVVLISSGLIRSFFLVLFLFIAFHYMLTKPLINLSVQMKQINPGSPGEQRLNRPHQTDDELNQLVQSANQLLDTVDLALAKRRAVEVVLRKSEEHVRQIIDSLPVWVGARNCDGYYIFANKALSGFLGTTPDQMRGSHIGEFEQYSAMSPSEIVALDAEVIKNRRPAQIWEEKWVDINGKPHQMHTYIMPMEFYDEVVALVVSSDITELKNTQELMEHMAYHDPLTDLPNRSYLLERLEEELSRATMQKVIGALLFIDLDQFKNINDSLGHPVGDVVLKRVAERLTSVTGDNDVVVRLSGDEFVIILTGLGDHLDDAVLRAEAAGERIKTSIAEPYYHNDFELHVTCSVGVVMFPDDDAGVHELLQYADTAMYQVKDHGRNAIQFFNRNMADNARNVLVMEGDLHKALENKRFSLHFQPRADSQSSEIVGAEALLRWYHPERGMVSPAEFIPVLETSGLIVEVGQWVISEAIKQVKQWQAQGLWHENMRIGVNISPRQFRAANFVDDVIKICTRESFPPNLIEMEITEGIVIQNLDETVGTMAALCAEGINFALDDFGTGYSSISYLKQLPVSILKIDKSFVRDLTVDRNDRVLVETISAMGNMLKLDVVAEGVETAEQLKCVQQYKCRYYQGYFCSKPLSPRDFERLLVKGKTAVQLV
ncbi:EAL domain-containing protein [Agarilytica rhodophyticola]|uniref:EAL domain-containing protein n=1 Tax=Agarilytica rhodophyticola TaxID=1737490 RepID=UPI000B349474|nr:EAL domain-containing protein [Agarilytica rhodophyticola]